jgi:hypothetical protein
MNKFIRLVKQLTCKHKVAHQCTVEAWRGDKLIDVEYTYECLKCGSRMKIVSDHLIPRAVIELADDYKAIKKIVEDGGIIEKRS